MKLILNSAEIRLLENAPISLRNAAGKQITCAAGTLWITFAGNAGDLFLVAGESCHVKGNGLVVAEAIGSASRVGSAAIPLLGSDGVPTAK